MAYIWTDDLAVGHTQIDSDHKHLYDLVNRLYDAMKAGKGNTVLGATLDELIRYTASHFGREEALMQQIRYAAAAEHKAAHTALVSEVQGLQQRFKTGSVALSPEVFKFLGDWLRNHIMTHDKLLGAAAQKR